MSISPGCRILSAISFRTLSIDVLDLTNHMPFDSTKSHLIELRLQNPGFITVCTPHLCPFSTNIGEYLSSQIVLGMTFGDIVPNPHSPGFPYITQLMDIEAIWAHVYWAGAIASIITLFWTPQDAELPTWAEWFRHPFQKVRQNHYRLTHLQENAVNAADSKPFNYTVHDLRTGTVITFQGW